MSAPSSTEMDVDNAAKSLDVRPDFWVIRRLRISNTLIACANVSNERSGDWLPSIDTKTREKAYPRSRVEAPLTHGTRGGG